MNGSFGDIGGFLAAVAGVVGNPLGLSDAFMDAVRLGVSAGNEAQLEFRRALKRFMSGPAMWLLLTCAFLFGLILLGVKHVTLDDGWALAGQSEEVKKIVRESFATTDHVVWYYCILPIVLTAFAVRALGLRLPLRVPYLLGGIVLVSTTTVASVMFHIHAFRSGNGWLLLLAAASAIVVLITMALIGGILSWLVRKGGALIETLLELGAPIVALAPGVTLENYREILSRLLDLIDEESWGDRISSYSVQASIAYLGYVCVACFWITPAWAVAWGAIYVLVMAIGYGALKSGLADEVDVKRKNFWKFLLASGAVILAITGPVYQIFVAEPIRTGVSGQNENAKSWIVQFLTGQVGIGGGRSIPNALGYLLFVGVIAWVTYHLTEKWKDEGLMYKVKMAIRAGAGLWLLQAIVVQGVACSVIGHPKVGATLPAVAQATTATATAAASGTSVSSTPPKPSSTTASTTPTASPSATVAAPEPSASAAPSEEPKPTKPRPHGPPSRIASTDDAQVDSDFEAMKRKYGIDP